MLPRDSDEVEASEAKGEPLPEARFKEASLIRNSEERRGMILKELSHDQKYEICVKRDSRFDGVFWFGSRESEVFCCPSCKARTPAYSKIQFYSSIEEAESMGYRPCRRCLPDKVPVKRLEDVWFRNCI